MITIKLIKNIHEFSKMLDEREEQNMFAKTSHLRKLLRKVSFLELKISNGEEHDIRWMKSFVVQIATFSSSEINNMSKYLLFCNKQ